MADDTKAIITTETQRAPTVFSLDQIKNSVAELDKFYKTLMQEGTDYGTLPGTPKPGLYKSGAELLRLRFNFNPEFKISKGLTDIQKGFIEYDITCSLYRDGLLVAEGVGNANSLESKWRYRWVDERELPKGTDKDSITTKWIKTKAGGSYPKYRMENENPQDLANTILKMAKKRAFVDGILTATGASRIFTQDVEDMDIKADEGDESPTPESVICPTHKISMTINQWGKYFHKLEGQKTDKGKQAYCQWKPEDLPKPTPDKGNDTPDPQKTSESSDLTAKTPIPDDTPKSDIAKFNDEKEAYMLRLDWGRERLGKELKGAGLLTDNGLITVANRTKVLEFLKSECERLNT
jgi:hypothetical protein